ncbi:hypothetical protein GCM10011344_13490 [Dokdonia pacifica]|uniref:Uncharacterized protein n=1 Tax=Dokdonia pacifica TaxID=1627892 RepID=A0A238W8D1_9FLAO|nr:hypothetical protein [Dokdonia pacifica]GGG14166.1 hypothetical protein GCM10011344_13490 [Dokdonia pacifica]SNR42802.1 hypothetical protein SAMN06265376_101799 [Dokdonia pacifica]
METYFLWTLIFFISSVLILFYFENKFTFQIIKSILPKVFSKILLVSFALITFIFGIHADVFSSYDKYTANLDRQYDWFSIEDILRFPVEQYGINVKDLYPSNIIDFQDNIITEYPTRKITILLDKTGSIKDSKESKIKQRLVNKLNDQIYDFEKHIDTSTIKVEDLFLLTALEQLTRDEKRNLTHIEVLIYTGSEKNVKVVNHIEKALKIDYDEYDDSTRSKAIIDCLKKINVYNTDDYKKIINNRFTDFYELGKELKAPKFIGNGTTRNNGYGKKYDHTSIILLSDFYHEEAFLDKNVKDVENVWYNIRNRVSQLNLISFNNSNTSSSSKYVSKAIKETFRRNFNHLYFFEYEEHLDNQLAIDEEINTMFSTVIDAKVAQPLITYHSWNKQDYKFDYKGEVQILRQNGDRDLVVGFANRIRPKNYIKPYDYITISKESSSNSPDEIKLYEYQKGKLKGSNSDIYEISFLVDEIESKNFFLEYSYPNTSYAVRHPILFKPVLPVTACLYLFALYLVFTFTSLYLFFYYLICLLRLKIKKNKTKPFLWISLMFYVLMTVYLGCHLSILISDLILYNKELLETFSIVIIVSVILFSIFLHIISYKDYRDRLENEIIKIKS